MYCWYTSVFPLEVPCVWEFSSSTTEHSGIAVAQDQRTWI